MNSSFARVFIAALLAATSGCQSSGAAEAMVPADGLRGTPLAPSGGVDFRLAGKAGTNASLSQKYSYEQSLGAKCPSDDVERSQSSGMIMGACVGRPPPDFAKLLMAIPEGSLDWPLANRAQWLEDIHPLIAVAGLGVVPDLLVGDEALWMRSFQGTDASGTTYLVQGPSASSGDRRCQPLQLNLRAYRVASGNQPRLLPGSAMPQPASMTASERKRYGPHIGSNIEEACDSDVEADLTRLQLVPVIRWAISDFDPDVPIPSSDPRVFGEWGQAHFGFVVWNGSTFELRERVSSRLWPCIRLEGVGGHCRRDTDEELDRFVTNAKE